MPAPFKWIADFTVGSHATLDRARPTLIARENGTFDILIAQEFSTDFDFRRVSYSADGTLGGSATISETSISVNSYAGRGAELSDGRIAYVWTEAPVAGGGDGFDVYYRVMYPDGTTNVDRTLIAGGAGNQLDAVIAASDAGGFAIAYNDMSVAEGQLVLKFYSVTGQLFSTINPANTTTGVYNFNAIENQISITAMSNGNYFVAWADGSPYDIRARVFSPAGVILGGEINIEVGADISGFPHVTSLDSGLVLVSWTTSTGNIRAQIRQQNGSMWTDGITLATGVGVSSTSFEHDVTSLGDGRYVVVYTTSGGEVMGRVYKDELFGVPDGGPFAIASSTEGDQMRPQVALLADGRFVVTWEDHNGGVIQTRATIFDPRETGVNQAGSSGSDDLWGTSFADVFYVGDGNDTVHGADGADYVVGGKGVDSLFGGDGNDLLYGGNDADNLQGENGDDYLFGGEGSDTLSGGANNDIIYGERGNDFIAGDANNDTLIGGEGHDSLYGGDGDDSLDGGEGYDTFYGGAGNDFMRGGILGDQDTMMGEAGNDLIFGEGGGDSIDGGADNDTVYGGEGNDTIQGGTGIDSLLGENGADLIYGGDGADSIDGGNDNDTVYGGVGNDTIQGGAGADSLLGESGADLIYGGDGADSIDGAADNDTVYGGAGNDTVQGGSGADTLIGEGGADTLYGGDDADSIDGGADNDILRGEGGNDFIQGGDGDDFIDGGAQVDDLRGGAGNDTIIGGAGNDTMYGQGGNDVFRFAVGSGADAIIGWEDGLDRIDISTYAGATFANTVITQVGADTRVTFVGGDSVLLIGVNAATVTLADFITA